LCECGPVFTQMIVVIRKLVSLLHFSLQGRIARKFGPLCTTTVPSNRTGIESKSAYWKYVCWSRGSRLPKVNSSCLVICIWLQCSIWIEIHQHRSIALHCMRWEALSICLSETSCISTKTSWNTWANQQLNGQANKHLSWVRFDPRDRNLYQRAIDFTAGVLLDTEPMCENLMLKISCVLWRIGRFRLTGFGFGFWWNRNNGLDFSPTLTSIRRINVEKYVPQCLSSCCLPKNRTKLQWNFKVNTVTYFST
jgi:hypothetical protein